MNQSFQLLTADDPRWSCYLDRTDHDFFHTAAYHRLWERSGHGRAFLAVYGTADRFVAWPYLLNSLESVQEGAAGADVTCVYGYAGPVCRGCLEGDELQRSAWAQFVNCWRGQGVVSVFARLHPILANDRIIADTPSARSEEGPGVVHQGQTVAINLTAGEEEILRNYRREVRRNIRQAAEAGIEAVFDPDWRYFDDFLTLYYATMERNQASSFYFFSREYLEGLRLALGEHGSLVLSRYRGRIVAACLMIECCGIASTHLTASELVVQGCSPAKLLIHDSQIWARRRGNRVFHLGGGRGSNEDSLFSFKATFSPQRFRFSTGRWILDPARYYELARSRREQAYGSGSALTEAFFPAYRAPLVAPREPLSARAASAGGNK